MKTNPPILYLKQRHIQLLLSLSATHHLGRTAEALYMSQPAASKSLAQLESEIGHPLFKRSGSGMQPTELGELLITHAKNLTGAATHLPNEIDALINRGQHLLRLGILPSSAQQVAPALISDLLHAEPRLDISVHEDLLHNLIAALNANQLDCIIGRTSTREISDQIEGIFLYDDPVCIVSGKNTTLNTQPSMSLNELSQYFWILPAKDSILRERVNEMFDRLNIAPPKQAIQSNSILTNLMLLNRHPWLTVLPQVLAEHFAQQGSITILPIDTKINSGNVQIMIRKDKQISPALELAIQLLKKRYSHHKLMPKIGV